MIVIININVIYPQSCFTKLKQFIAIMANDFLVTFLSVYQETFYFLLMYLNYVRFLA